MSIPAQHGVDVSAPEASSTSSFLSRMAHLPGLNAGRSTRTNVTLERRTRRFSLTKPRDTRVARSPPSSSPAPPLKRSKSARASLIASARRLSSSALRFNGRATDSLVANTTHVCRHVESQDEAPSQSYANRSLLFATSSPELATPGEEKDEWAVYPNGRNGESPLCADGHRNAPRLRWASDEGESPSCLPVRTVPIGLPPAIVADSARSIRSQSLGVLVDEPGTEPHIPRARSPRAVWSPPILPTPLESPGLPTRTQPHDGFTSSPTDEAVRAANRAEALFKLTSPTPASVNTPDRLAAFPFPAMDASPAIPGALLSALSSAPSAEKGSVSLILPKNRASGSENFPPPLVRSNTVGLHPAPIPLDINMKGHLVRARNSKPAATTSPSLTISSSPDSVRFSDRRPSVGSRRSSETSLALSTEDDGEGRTPKAGFYGLSTTERRAIESAVDVLAIVEEDEAPLSSAPPLRAKRSPSKRGPGDSPMRRRSSDTAAKKHISLEIPAVSANAETCIGSGPSVTTSPVSLTPPRLIRPARLSMIERSLSSGAAIEPTTGEKDELGLRSQRDLNPMSSRMLYSSPTRAQPGKRCTSDVRGQVRPSISEGERRYGVGLGLPSSLGADGDPQAAIRTRHQSLALYDDHETGSTDSVDLHARRISRRMSSGGPTRTKLVLRENGKPVLTYQLGESIGRGQFGSVYRALNLSNGQVVAVKRILLEGKTEREIEELSREVKLLRRLSHPGIIRYEGAVRTEHYLNIILEYGESGSLEKTIKQFGQLPEVLVASWTVKILEGLAYLHDQGVVHCDLKAANILSTKQGNIKLSDFGVSLNLNAIKATQGFHQSMKEANGTPNWMAPEVISLKGALPASDIWSLGATLVELIDGAPPYAGLVAMSAMFRIVEDPEGPPIPDRCSPELRAFLKRCFRKDPQDRPTAEELLSDPWLTKHCDMSANIRPQDSLPFIRRIPSEQQRPMTENSALSLAEALAFPTEPLKQPTPAFLRDEQLSRTSFDSGYSAGSERATSPEPCIHASTTANAAAGRRPHSFVRSSFSKALICKVCGEQTKRHAVLCQDCGLISHVRCKEFAPSCDLRAQLLGLSTSALPSGSCASVPPPARFPVLPKSPASPHSPSFALSDYLPFRNSRRPSATATAGGGIRQLLTSSKSRTPGSTPPSSLKYQRVVEGDSAVSTAPSERCQDPMSLCSSRPTLVPIVPIERLAVKSSTNVRKGHDAGTVQAEGGQALDRKRNHARSKSQPVARLAGGGNAGSGVRGPPLARILSGGQASASASGPEHKSECAVM